MHCVKFLVSLIVALRKESVDRNTNPGSTSLTFPGFGVEIDGVSYDVWADTKYNLSDIDDKFGGLMSVVRFATALLVYLALIRYLVNTYHRIFGEGE